MEQTKSQPKVSILIPVYNTASYLPKCLASAMNQTLKEIEIIAVNDASPDNAAEVLADYAARDPRIKVITHEKNGGILAARLSGIAAATGEYMMVLDADDYLDLDTVRACYAKAKKTGADMIHFCFDVRIGHQKKNHFARSVEKRINPYHGKLLGREVFEGGFVKYLYSWNICGKFIAADIWRKAAASLPPGYYIMAEDFCFYTMLSWYATHYEPLFKKCYHYGLDIGVSNYGLTDYQGFLRNCTVFAALKAVKSFLQKQGCFEHYEKEFRKQERGILDELLERWEKKLTRIARIRILTYMFENYAGDGLMRSFIGCFAGRENILGSLMGMPEYFKQRKVETEVRHAGLYLEPAVTGPDFAQLLLNCAADWRKAGIRVSILTPADQSFDLPQGMVQIPVPAGLTDREEAKRIRRSDFWFELREKYGIDTVVHGAADVPEALFDAMSLKVAGLRLISAPQTGFHSLEDTTMGTFLAKMRGLLIADAVAVQSDSELRFFSSFGKRCSKIAVPAVNVHGEIPLPEGKNRILWLGYLGDPEAETVLCAWAKIAGEFPDCRLSMVGRTPGGRGDRSILEPAAGMHVLDSLEVHVDPAAFNELLPKSRLFFMTSGETDSRLYADAAETAGIPCWLSHAEASEMLAEELRSMLNGTRSCPPASLKESCTGLDLFRKKESEPPDDQFPADDFLEILSGYQQKIETYVLLPANRGPSFIQLFRRLDKLVYRILPAASGRRDSLYQYCRYILGKMKK